MSSDQLIQFVCVDSVRIQMNTFLLLSIDYQRTVKTLFKLKMKRKIIQFISMLTGGKRKKKKSIFCLNWSTIGSFNLHENVVNVKVSPRHYIA